MENNLAAWMDRAGLTARGLAKETGIHHQQICRVSAQNGRFSSVTLAKVGKVIADRVEGATVGDVLTGLVCPEADEWCPVGGEE